MDEGERVAVSVGAIRPRDFVVVAEQGDLLLAGDQKDIWRLATAAIDPTLEASYAGDAELLIAGDDPSVDLGAKIVGLDVLESDISGGGWDYDAGSILIALDGDDAPEPGAGEGHGQGPGARADLAVWDIQHPRDLSYWLGHNPLERLFIAGRDVSLSRS